MKKNYIYNLILSISNILFPILSFPYASRILGPAGIGKAQFTLTLAQYFGLFAAFGIPVYGIQEIAKQRHSKSSLSKTFSELIYINIISSILVSLLYILFISNNNFFFKDYSLYIYSAIIVFLGFTSIDWAYSGLEEFKNITIRSVFIKSLSLIFLYLFVKKPGDYLIFFFISIFSLLGNNFISILIFTKKIDFVYKDLDLKKHLRPLVFIFASTIAASMYTYLDTILLGFLANEKSVGFYTAALKLTKIAIPFITAAGTVLIPQFAIETKANNKESVQNLLNNSWHYIVFFSIPICIGLLIYSNEFILLLSGIAFKEASITMKLLSPLPFIIGLGYFFGFQILIPSGKNKEMFYSVLVGMFISLILNFFLVPFLKENGTALTSLITEILVTSLYFYFVKLHYSYSYNWMLIIKSIIACIGFLPISILIKMLHLNLLTSLITSFLLCCISYISIQLLIFKDKFIKEYIEIIKRRFIKL